MWRPYTHYRKCRISIESIRRGTPYVYDYDYTEEITKVIATLGRECGDQEDGKINEAVEAIIAENSRPGDICGFH